MAASKLYYWVYDEEFIIEDDDCKYYFNYIYQDLLEITGAAGEFLSKIEFLTYKGKKKSFGGKEENTFKFCHWGFNELRSN